MAQQLKGWHSRGYLPHFDGGIAQFVTFRLFDSLPQTLLKQFEVERKHNKLGHYSREFQLKVEEYLDQGIGSCYLRRSDIAEMIKRALFFYSQNRYRLIAWVIMPNHLHLLIRPNEGNSLSVIMKDLKGYTSRQANNIWEEAAHFGKSIILTDLFEMKNTTRRRSRILRIIR